MQVSDDIYNYENIDVIEYFNSKHQIIDLIEIESQFSSKKAILRRIDDNLYDFFIQSSESLLSMVDTYKQCLDLLKEFKGETYSQVNESEKAVISEELAKKLNLFNDDMRIFLTEERYLVTSGFFNENSILCVLSNDLIFIGEKSEKKYNLKKSVPKSMIKMKKNENSIEIIFDTGKLDLNADKNTIEDFYEAFQEISYVYKGREQAKPEEIDFSLLNFYIQTGCYDEFIEYFQVNRKYTEEIEEFLESIDIQEINILKCIMKVTSKPEKFCSKFFFKRLISCLNRINKVQGFDMYIEEIFEFLKDFCENIEIFYNENKLSRISLVLQIEQCTRETIKYLENRIAIYSKVFHHKNTVEILEKHLEFLNMDFKYLIRELVDIPFVGTERMMKEAKEAIVSNIEEYLAE